MRSADIISCATGSGAPLVKGDWLRGEATNPAQAMSRFQLPMQFAQANEPPVFILPNNWQNDAHSISDTQQSSYDPNSNKPNGSTRPIQ